MKFQPDWFSRPGDTLTTLMTKKGLSPRALAERLNYNVEEVHGLLSGILSIDYKIARDLAENVGGSQGFWQRRQSQFEINLDRLARALPPEEARAWARLLPIKEMKEAGWVRDPRNPLEVARSLLSFFDVDGLDDWRDRYTAFKNAFAFRTSSSFESKIGALATWLRAGEIQAAMIHCRPWSPSAFRELLPNIRVLTKARNPEYFVPRLRQMCAEIGVAVTFVRAPAGCRASGAARFLSPTKAMIVLSFRYLSDDHFWFTFFHEAAHLLLHGSNSTFVDGEVSEHSTKEEEANTFAAGVLVPSDRLEELMILSPRMEPVIRFALSIGVSPGIVVGQMQHRRVVGPHQLNRLKRRYDWQQIMSAIG